MASVNWRSKTPSLCSIKAAGRNSSSMARISASAACASHCKSSRPRLASSRSRSQTRGIASAMAATEKRLCVTASCRSRARRSRSAVAAASSSWVSACLRRDISSVVTTTLSICPDSPKSGEALEERYRRAPLRSLTPCSTLRTGPPVVITWAKGRSSSGRGSSSRVILCHAGSL